MGAITINLAKKISPENLVSLLNLFRTEANWLQGKLDHKIEYDQINLSHSIVKHTDASGETFYDVYAKDEERLGKGKFGKVKPIICRLFVNAKGALEQILNPGLVVKVLEATDVVKQEAENVSDVYRGVSEVSEVRDSKGREKVDYVMPYMGSGLLQQHDDRHTKEDFDKKLSALIAAFKAVKVLHEEEGCIHGDLKPANILYDETTATAFLIDFNSQKLTIATEVETFNGTYFSPEVMSLEQSKITLTAQIDIYALGKTAEAILGDGKNYEGSSFQFLTVPNSQNWQAKRKELVTFLKSLIDENPNNRPSVDTSIQFLENFREAYKSHSAEAFSEDARAKYANPHKFIQQLERLANNIPATIKIIEEDQKRLIHKEYPEHQFLEDGLLPKAANLDMDFPKLSEIDQKKYQLFEQMVKDLKEQEAEVNVKVDGLKDQLVVLNQPSKQIFNNDEVNQKHVEFYKKCKSTYEGNMNDAIKLVARKEKRHEQLNEYGRVWIIRIFEKMFSGIAQVLGSTKFMPKSAQALETAEATLHSSLPKPR